MAGLSSLYDKRDNFYPIYHVAILAFVITVSIPVNLGLSKLPMVDVIVLIFAGFVSLFMLARNDSVGDALLTHLRIKIAMPQKKETSNLHARYDGVSLNAYDEYRQDPLFLLQDALEHIIISHDEEMDLATRVRIGHVHQRLQMVTRQLCKL